MSFEELLPFVQPYAAAAPDQVVLHHIKLAAVEFCGRTLAWQAELDPVETAVGAGEHTLNLPAGTELVRLLGVNVAQDEYTVTTADKARRVARSLARATSGRMAWSINRQDLMLHPAPSVVASLEVLAALKPQILIATELPDDLRQYAETIACGARASLLRTPGDWKDPMEASTQRVMFDQSIGTIGAEVARGFGGARMRPGFTPY
jgi:hypothetical protein